MFQSSIFVCVVISKCCNKCCMCGEKIALSNELCRKHAKRWEVTSEPAIVRLKYVDPNDDRPVYVVYVDYKKVLRTKCFEEAKRVLRNCIQ